jgi:hypothetical protein
MKRREGADEKGCSRRGGLLRRVNMVVSSDDVYLMRKPDEEAETRQEGTNEEFHTSQ